MCARDDPLHTMVLRASSTYPTCGVILRFGSDSCVLFGSNSAASSDYEYAPCPRFCSPYLHLPALQLESLMESVRAKLDRILVVPLGDQNAEQLGEIHALASEAFHRCVACQARSPDGHDSCIDLGRLLDAGVISHLVNCLDSDLPSDETWLDMLASLADMSLLLDSAVISRRHNNSNIVTREVVTASQTIVRSLESHFHLLSFGTYAQDGREEAVCIITSMISNFGESSLR